MENNQPLLSVSNLSVNFDSQTILKNVSFNLNHDEIMAIIGPNGAGKTMLFRAILGLIPYEGTVKWDTNVRIGYVPQKLFVSRDLALTVGEFLSCKEKEQKKITYAMSRVGIAEKQLKIQLSVLSGGEFQRVLIAFALLGDPNVLLFDEPTSGIDISGEETVYGLIKKLQKEKDLAILFISHELDVVYAYAQNVLCLNKKTICMGPPQEVIDKENLQKLYNADVHLYQHH